MSRSDQYDIPETAEEARLNRGIITVMEQTKATEDFDEGDRFVLLGKRDRLYKLVGEGTPDQDFVPQAVPLAHIELPCVLDSRDELTEWVNSDLGKLALAQFLEADAEPDDTLTPWGEERDLLPPHLFEAEYGDRLADTVATMRGEADELEARDDVDDHLNDVISGLRFCADEMEAFLDETYYETAGIGDERDTS